MAGRQRDLWWAGAIWLVVTAVGEWVVRSFPLIPGPASAQGEEIDFAFNLLLVYAVPVLAFVLVAMGYSVVKWRVAEPAEDAHPVQGHRGFEIGWFSVSVALAALLFFYPGLSGILALANHPGPDMTMEMEGVQWHWNVKYTDQGVALENPPEIVLPEGHTIRVLLTSRDVIHSFWVPAFRVKQDAIPGEVRTAVVTTTELGDYAADPKMRLQCAELCGTGHANMFVPIRVVTAEEFSAWLTQMGGNASGMGGMDMGGGAAPSDGHGG